MHIDGRAPIDHRPVSEGACPGSAGKRVELFDTRVPGFGVRISDTEDSNPARRGKAGKLTFIL